MNLVVLETSAVDVWTIANSPGADTLGACEAIVGEDELRRAGRFRLVVDRHRYLGAHAALRMILAQYVDQVPSGLRFQAGAHGKPYLPDYPRIRFNLSHAGELAIVAVTRDREVGVDIEVLRKDIDVDSVSRQAFAAAERSVLTGLAAEERIEAFFRIWTRKEAYVKALGSGLSYRTAGFAVCHRPGATDALLFDEASPDARDRWRVADIPAPNGSCAALAMAGDGWRIAMHSSCTRDLIDDACKAIGAPRVPSSPSHNFERSLVAAREGESAATARSR